MKRFISKTKLGKSFVLMGIALVVIFVGLYIAAVRYALGMPSDPAMPCNDDLNKMSCEDPYGASIFWAAIMMGFFLWPAILAWLVIGFILTSRKLRKKNP